MTLRYKFGSLALLYVLALAINLVLCAWCILQYQQFVLAGLGEGSRPVRLLAMEPGHEHTTILRILLLNAVCGLAVALIAVRLVQRWVSRPIAELHRGAKRIAGGDFSTPVPVYSHDELGTLAADVNEMALMVVQMQTALAEQERRAVVGRALRCIVHNIRSPLTGVRWLAEAVAARRELPEPLREGYTRLITVVDSILEWLQAFRHLMTNTSLQPRCIEVDMLLTPLRESECVVSINAREAGCVHVDPTHLGPALHALVSAAAGERQDPVDILAEPNDNRGGWHLRIQPKTFAAEREIASAGASAASGAVLMAESIVHLHHGRLDVRHDSAGRTAFDVFLTNEPGRNDGGYSDH